MEPRGNAVFSIRDNDLLVRLSSGSYPPEGFGLVKDDKIPTLFRTLPIHFPELKKTLLKSREQVQVDFDEAPALPFSPVLGVEPRSYQLEALQRWLSLGKRGVVVLPTGAGKTLLALMAISSLRLWTLVVVPTIDLLHQWRDSIVRNLKVKEEMVGIFGGGSKSVMPITVMTYDSASIYTKELNKFALLVFDEVHHLPAPGYKSIALGAFAPYRLGLSATPERSDMLHVELEKLVGPEVYRKLPSELKSHLAAYVEKRLFVSLSEEERAKYTSLMAKYGAFLASRGITIRSHSDFQRKIIWRSAFDPAAREAMLARHEARLTALNAKSKLEKVEELLATHIQDRAIIFSEYNSIVENISRRFCIPAITHKTPADERKAILERFRSGAYTKMVTGRVLNEGIDVPDANVGIMVSGSATKREYIQRLGRLLRPKLKEAVLYELVSSATSETAIAGRRHPVPAGGG